MNLDKFLFKDKSKYKSVVLTTFLVGAVFGAVLFWGISGYLFVVKNEGLPSTLPVWYLIFILPIQTGVLFQIFPGTYMLIRHWHSSFVKYKPMIVQVLFGFTMFFIFHIIMMLSIVILIYLVVDVILLYTKKWL